MAVKRDIIPMKDTQIKALDRLITTTKLDSHGDVVRTGSIIYENNKCYIIDCEGAICIVISKWDDVRYILNHYSNYVNPSLLRYINLDIFSDSARFTGKKIGFKHFKKISKKTKRYGNKIVCELDNDGFNITVDYKYIKSVYHSFDRDFMYINHNNAGENKPLLLMGDKCQAFIMPMYR